MKIYYDFHIHSCLSPCGDNDNTPNNIVNMSLLKGLQAIALSDHNTGKNCPAAIEAGKRNGLVVLPAMELTTSEDIHILCLFEKYERLAMLEEYISERRMKIKNREEIFGEQLILNEYDEPIGKEEYLLLASAGVSVQKIAALVKGFGGIAVPAHIDKQSNGLIGVLGAFDETLGFEMIESKRDCGVRLPRLINSDAHRLWEISEAENQIEAETLSAHGVFAALQEMCRK